MVDSLVQRGATIISGLANGCDSIAHKQALQSQGKTVAVLPSPLHNILPAGNRELAMEILQKEGLLVTEYLNDATSKMTFIGRYKERDRLQALFSDAIILASSYAKNNVGNDSGSRLAMEYAHQYEIPRAVMYEASKDAENPKYDLNRQLMREQQDITVIANSDIEEKITDLLNLKPLIENNVFQDNLF